MSAFQRSISYSSQRQALTVALLGVGAVIVGTILLLLVTDHGLEKVFFEAISAFGTVRLSTGITSGLPAAAQLVLMVLMFTGRIGTITVASALAIASRPRLYQLPEERPSSGELQHSDQCGSSRAVRFRSSSPRCVAGTGEEAAAR